MEMEGRAEGEWFNEYDIGAGGTVLLDEHDVMHLSKRAFDL